MTLAVRPAASADAELIAGLTRACWAGKVAASSSGHRETAAVVAGQLREGGGFIVLLDGAPAGSVRWAPLALDPAIWEIRRMGVLPAQRGAGLARHLLDAVLRQARESGAAELRLAVRSDQPRLIDFYVGFGFALAAELEYGHANPAEPAPAVMRRRLRP
jgi:ribosomal protein S18 acetylase RimI-like enzyme